MMGLCASVEWTKNNRGIEVMGCHSGWSFLLFNVSASETAMVWMARLGESLLGISRHVVRRVEEDTMARGPGDLDPNISINL